MASDSDVEAYLNQLSRKTYSLKQDVQSRGYTSSHPSSTADKASDDLDLSDESSSPIRTVKQSSSKHKKEDTGPGSDLASYSKKHGGLGLKKTYTHDKFSTLEQKYLKKASPSKYATGSKILGHKHDHDNASHRQKAEELEYDGQASSDKKTSKSTIKQKTRVISDDSSVDEELARYLNETSLTGNQEDEFHGDARKSKTHSFSEDCDDSTDEVFNLDNILALDDILDQVTDNESRAQDDDNKYESRCSGSSRNNSLIEKSETIISDAVPQNHKSTNPPIRNKNASLKTSSLQAKSLNSAKSNILQDSKQVKKHDNEKKDVSTLFSSRKSVFYSNTQQDDSDHDKPVGILLAQSSTNVFHSSRRKSSIEFDILENSVRPKTSKYSSRNIEKMGNSEEYSEECVGESIASNQRSIAESVIDDQSISAEVDKSVEENLAISVAESLAEYSQALEKTEKDISKSISGTEESISLKAHSQNTRKSKHDNSLKVKSITKHSSSRQGRSEPPHQSDISESRDISDHKENTKEEKSKRSEKARKNRYNRRESKKKYRTSTSESSSSNSFSDSERDWHRRRHSRSHRYKWKYAFKPWNEPPNIQPWFHHYHHPYATPAGILTHSLGPGVLEGFVGLGGAVGVKELMQQQVALTRQFLDSQQALYHAYTATLTSSYRYTSLRSTEKYIKKRKPPLTFSEAYKLVKEEMKAQE